MFKEKIYTVANVLEQGRQYLKSKSIDTYDIDARVLLSFILGIEHYIFISQPKTEVPKRLYLEYIRLIKKRGKSVPVAQLTGNREFWSLPFKISKHTLIPRPDSETLVEATRSEIKDDKTQIKILDLGVGSGCLLLSLLYEFENGTGFGMDIENKTIKIAKENATKLKFDNRTTLFKYNWHKEKVPSQLKNIKFDIIVSNPPYISCADMKILDKEVVKYEPRHALYGGCDGLNEYRGIAASIFHWNILKQNGLIFIELGKGQETDVRVIFETFGFKFVRYFNDINAITRVIEFIKK